MPSIYPNDYRTIIEALVRARKASKITQVQLASALRVPQSVISKIERCERRLDIAELIHICELIGVEAETLISGVPTRFTPLLASI